MSRTVCIGCGAAVPDVDGPVHAYMTSAPGCWARYGELLAWSGSGADGADVTVAQLAVDTFAAQHPTNRDPRNVRSVAVHLMSLCCALERSVPGEVLRRWIGGWTDRDVSLLAPAPPAFPDPICGVVDLDPASRADAVRRSAVTTWAAWSRHHDTVRGWVEDVQKE